MRWVILFCFLPAVVFAQDSMTLGSGGYSAASDPDAATSATFDESDTNNVTLSSGALNITFSTNALTLGGIAAGSFLRSDADDTASGNLTFTGVLDFQAAVTNQGNMTVSDDVWHGLGASAGRIEWDDQATDEVNILGANVGIGTNAPAAALHIGDATPTTAAEGIQLGGDVSLYRSAANTLKTDDDFSTALDLYFGGNEIVGVSGLLYIRQSTVSGSRWILGSSAGVQINTDQADFNFTHKNLAGYFNIWSDAGTYNVGFGTNAPSETVHVHGNVSIAQAGSDSAPSSAADQCKLYVTNASAAELWVIDGSGNNTLLSPHADGDVAGLLSVNRITGKRTEINLEALASALEKATGRDDLITITRFKPTDSWDAMHTRMHNDEHAKWEEIKALHDAWEAADPATRGDEPQEEGPEPVLSVPPQPQWITDSLAANPEAK